MQLAAQVKKAQQAQVDAVIGIAGKTFSVVEQLIALNLRTARDALAGSSEAARVALAARDVPSLLEAQAALVQPARDKAVAYSREVYAIMTAAGAELGKVAETSALQAQQRVAAVVNAASQDVPVLTSGATELLKSSVAVQREVAPSASAAVAEVSEAIAPIAPSTVDVVAAVVSEKAQAPLVAEPVVKAPVRTTPVANAAASAGKGRNKR